MATKDISNSKHGMWKQVLGSVVASMASFVAGAVGAFVSVQTYAMEKGQGGIKITLEEASWIATLVCMGYSLGPVVLGFANSFLGRRQVMFWFGIPVVLFYAAIGSSQDKVLIYFGNFMVGFLQSMPFGIVGAYISETVHASHRNTLNSIQIVMVGFGSLFALVLGYLLDWRPIAFILAAVSFVTTFSILFLPETPYYLIEKGKNSDARASLIFFRGSECDTIDQELAEIIEARDQKGGGLSVGRCRVLTSHSFLKPFLCIGPIHFLFRLSSYYIICLYTTIFLDKAGVEFDPTGGSIVVCLFKLIMALSTTLLLSKISKKLLFVSSGVCGTIGICAMAVSGLLQNPYSSFATLIGASIVQGCYSVLLGIIVVIASEIYPTDIRGISMALTLGFGYAAAMISAKIFPYQVDSLGFHGTMWVHAAISAVMTLWASLTLQDTDGLTLVEVERMYDSRMEQGKDCSKVTATTSGTPENNNPFGMIREALHKIKANAVRKRSTVWQEVPQVK